MAEELSKLFHKYINYMMTTDDRYLIKANTYPCEVCGYWRDRNLSKLRKEKANAPIVTEAAAAIYDHRFNKMTPELPIVVFKHNNFLMILYCTPCGQPDLSTIVATKDWYQIIKEASRLGLYVLNTDVADPTVVPFIVQ